MPTAKLVIVWRITEVCDLACPFCAYSRALPHPRATANRAQVERLGSLLGQYAAQTGRPVLVSWLGGEPLLWKPIFEISRQFKHEFGLRLSVTTNGTALNSETTRYQLMDTFDELTISVDGTPAQHDAWRGKAGLWTSLKTNLQQLAALKKNLGYGPRLRVNTILMRDTVEGFEALCLELAQWGVEELTFNALGGRDRPEFFPDHHLLPADLNRLRTQLPALRARLAPLGLNLLGDSHYLNRLTALAQGQPLPVADCAPGTRFWFIDEQGYIAPCSYTGTGYGIHLNEVQSLADIAQLPHRFAEQQRTNLLEICGDCPSTQVFGKFQSA